METNKQKQFLFFRNCTWEVTAAGITQQDGDVVRKDVIEHRVKVLDNPAFTITKNADCGSWDIEIHHSNCLFMNFLINTSRIHWRKELEEELGKLPEDEREQYRLKHKFNIAGPLLTKDEQQEQKLHLINKLFALGYLLHRYKDRRKAWAVVAVDKKVDNNGRSSGGSGKSIMIDQAMREVLKTFTLSGRNPSRMADPHFYDGLSEHHQYVYVDNLDKDAEFRVFYNLITSDVIVNPRMKRSYIIPFEKSPKLALTTCFNVNYNGPSTQRRILYTIFSDYYHNASEHNGYKESRSPDTDLGKILFINFTPDEWNQFYNTMARALQFYLSTDEKIGPLIDNVMQTFKKGDIVVRGNVVAMVETETGAEEFAKSGWKLAKTVYSEKEIFGDRT